LGYGVGGNGGSSECEGRRDHGGYPNFNNMTRLPRFLFGREPAPGLVVHELIRKY
jgi:hypothetical protein